MKIVAISDTHNKLHKLNLPKGDIIIHAGDLTGRGSESEIEHELDKLAKLGADFKHIILICGNHDWLGETKPELMKKMCEDRNITYLDNSGVEIEGIKFWGSAWTPWFYSWAFNARRTETESAAYGGPWIKTFWDLIPDDTNVLITHGPPAMILDSLVDVVGDEYNPPRRVGCDELAAAVKRVKPKYHIFGHIHVHGGRKLEIDGTIYCNVAVCDEMYSPNNAITVVEYEKV